MQPGRSWLLEASWEVCNKVGGIHTVIVSKLPCVLQEYGDRYLSVGPWLPDQQPEFREETYSSEYFADLSERLRADGVILHYGRWQVPGRPKVVLLEWSGLVPKLDELKARYWEAHSLDSLGSDFYDFDTPLLWGTAVGIFAVAFNETSPSPITLQLHEWLSAAALLIVPKRGERMRTVFTTHATVLGRSMAGRGIPIYDQLESIDPVSAAKEYGVQAKHGLERIAANLADSFTTVSDLTAEEALHFLGRHPDVVTENGLALHELPLLLTNQVVAATTRQRLEMLVADMLKPYYPFDASRSLWQCTTGRFELHNKGYDVYLQALAQENEALKASNSKESVVAVLLIAVSNQGIRQDVLTSQLRRLSGQPDGQPRQSTSLPPLSPFITRPDDPLVVLATSLGLCNRLEDRVKILYLPAYFDGQDGLLNIPLYDLISSCDLGVFPSAYEPWGYTPLECLALGVPAITSDLAGFGQAVRSAEYGVSLLKRRGVLNPVPELCQLMDLALERTPRELETERIAAYGLSRQFGWERLYENYRTAYEQAWQ